MKKYSITYLKDRKSWTIRVAGEKQLQDHVAMILNAGGEVVSVQVRGKILENIDYTLSRKGHRTYWIIDEDGCIVDHSGSWRTKSACRNRMDELGMVYTGTVTENRNYKHWADFQPVKEGRMVDDEN